MTAVYKKECRSLIYSLMGWLFLAVLSFFLGLFFVYYNLVGGSPYLAYPISSVLIFVLLLVPILTMRIWSEERKHKTDQLLFTAPVSTSGILIGKFLAIETIFAAAILLLGGYMLLLGRYGIVPYGENVLALIGFFLFGSACLSIGFFLSALTESQVLAAVMTYVVLMASAFLPNITGLFFAGGNDITQMLNNSLDLTIRLNTMMNGIIDLETIYYYLSVTALFLFLTWLLLSARRRSLFADMAGRLRYGGMLVCALVLVFGGNIGIRHIPADMTQYDVTVERMYSLTDTTRELLKELEEDVTIYVLAEESQSDNAIAMLLRQYEAGSSHIRVEYRSPARFPEFAAFYTTEDLDINSLIVVGQERYKVIPYGNCYETAEVFDYETYSYYETATGFDAEGQITSGLAFVISEDVPIVYALSGHEEYALPEELIDRFSKMNVEVRSINLMQSGGVPEDAAAILVCGPILDFSSEDEEMVRAYLDEGGSGLFFVAYSTENMECYESLFADYGILIEEGVVFETDSYYYKEYPYYLLPELANSRWTSELYTGQRLLLLPQCRGMKITEEYDEENLLIVPLANTSEQAYSKVSVTTMETTDKEAGDLDGPYMLAVYVERDNDDGSVSRLMITGTEYIVDPDINTFTADANYTYLLSALSGVVETVDLISVPAKEYELSPILVSTGAAAGSAVIIILVIPAVLLITGIIIVVVRRRRVKE